MILWRKKFSTEYFFMTEKNPPLPDSLFEGFLRQEQEEALESLSEEDSNVVAENAGTQPHNVLSTGLDLMEIVRKKQK